jgi:hypothetical protein
LRDWQSHWPFPNLKFLGFNWVEPDMEDVFRAYSQGYEMDSRPEEAVGAELHP